MSSSVWECNSCFHSTLSTYSMIREWYCLEGSRTTSSNAIILGPPVMFRNTFTLEAACERGDRDWANVGHLPLVLFFFQRRVWEPWWYKLRRSEYLSLQRPVGKSVSRSKEGRIGWHTSEYLPPPTLLTISYLSGTFHLISRRSAGRKLKRDSWTWYYLRTIIIPART